MNSIYDKLAIDRKFIVFDEHNYNEFDYSVFKETINQFNKELNKQLKFIPVQTSKCNTQMLNHDEQDFFVWDDNQAQILLNYNLIVKDIIMSSYFSSEKKVKEIQQNALLMYREMLLRYISMKFVFSGRSHFAMPLSTEYMEVIEQLNASSHSWIDDFDQDLHSMLHEDISLVFSTQLNQLLYFHLMKYYFEEASEYLEQEEVKIREELNRLNEILKKSNGQASFIEDIIKNKESIKEVVYDVNAAQNVYENLAPVLGDNILTLRIIYSSWVLQNTHSAIIRAIDKLFDEVRKNEEKQKQDFNTYFAQAIEKSSKVLEFHFGKTYYLENILQQWAEEEGEYLFFKPRTREFVSEEAQYYWEMANIGREFLLETGDDYLNHEALKKWVFAELEKKQSAKWAPDDFRKEAMELFGWEEKQASSN